MPIDVGALGGVVLRASLDELGSMTLDSADDLSGGSADGVVDVGPALVQASLSCAKVEAQVWIKAQPELSNAQGLASQAVALTLCRVAFLGGWGAAARTVWALVEGEGALADDRAVWVAGPAGLAIWGGTTRRSGLTEIESSVSQDSWDNILRRMNEAE